MSLRTVSSEHSVQLRAPLLTDPQVSQCALTSKLWTRRDRVASDSQLKALTVSSEGSCRFGQYVWRLRVVTPPCGYRRLLQAMHVGVSQCSTLWVTRPVTSLKKKKKKTSDITGPARDITGLSYHHAGP